MDERPTRKFFPIRLSVTIIIIVALFLVSITTFVVVFFLDTDNRTIRNNGTEYSATVSSSVAYTVKGKTYYKVTYLFELNNGTMVNRTSELKLSEQPNLGDEVQICYYYGKVYEYDKISFNNFIIPTILSSICLISAIGFVALYIVMIYRKNKFKDTINYGIDTKASVVGFTQKNKYFRLEYNYTNLSDVKVHKISTETFNEDEINALKKQKIINIKYKGNLAFIIDGPKVENSNSKYCKICGAKIVNDKNICDCCDTKYKETKIA